MSGLSSITRAGLSVAAITLVPITGAGTKAQQFIPDIIISSTIPANGDLNPYGVAFVPIGFPSGKQKILPGDVLVSNFNDINNTQGAGTTIISLTPNGASPRRCRQGRCPETQRSSFKDRGSV